MFRSFKKPVDCVVEEAICDWERERPQQAPMVDETTGEMVHYLFACRNQQIGLRYLNKHLIPALCRKAGVPVTDARGRITSHRARSTIASQLYNAKEPMSLFELQRMARSRHPAYHAALCQNQSHATGKGLYRCRVFRAGTHEQSKC